MGRIYIIVGTLAAGLAALASAGGEWLRFADGEGAGRPGFHEAKAYSAQSRTASKHRY
jgi:hypothetical protein